MKIQTKQIRYWDNFYKKFYTNRPSNFAKFFLKKIKKKTNILEVGSGNGRDSYFFLNKGYKVCSIDRSKKAIDKCKKIKVGNFIHGNFCSSRVNYKTFFKKKIRFSYIYARFFIHAINIKNENIFFNNCKALLKTNGRIYLEFRTTKDPLMKKGKKLSKYERITDHYRRFINVNELIDRIKKHKFKIQYIKKSNKFAVFKNDKPHICRLVIFK